MGTMLMSKGYCILFASRSRPTLVSRAIAAHFSDHNSDDLNYKGKDKIDVTTETEKNHLADEQKGRRKDLSQFPGRKKSHTNFKSGFSGPGSGKNKSNKYKSPVSNLIKSLEENEKDSQKDVDIDKKLMTIMSEEASFSKDDFHVQKRQGQGINRMMDKGRRERKFTKYESGTLFSGSNSKLFDWVGKIDTDSSSDSQFTSIHERKWKEELEALIPKHLPKNAFEEMMLYQEKVWNFPVDNEDKDEEENVGFEEHVFLDYLLDEFPDNEHIRRFMQLVVTGLQQNPYLTVDEKRDKILWFKDYFAQFPEEDLQV